MPDYTATVIVSGQFRFDFEADSDAVAFSDAVDILTDHEGDPEAFGTIKDEERKFAVTRVTDEAGEAIHPAAIDDNPIAEVVPFAVAGKDAGEEEDDARISAFVARSRAQTDKVIARYHKREVEKAEADMVTQREIEAHKAGRKPFTTLDAIRMNVEHERFCVDQALSHALRSSAKQSKET